VGYHNPLTLRRVVLGSDIKCNSPTQPAVYVRFRPYRPHGFVPGDASLLMSLTPQNAYNKLTTSTTHKALALDARFRCGISQSPTLRQAILGSDTKCNSPAQPVVYCPFWALRPHGFVHSDASSLMSLTSQNAYNRSATSTTHKALALDARFRCGISQSPHLKTSRPRL
jgi:hypothetical protein